jgi:hypothetical protein
VETILSTLQSTFNAERSTADLVTSSVAMQKLMSSALRREVRAGVTGFGTAERVAPSVAINQ